MKFACVMFQVQSTSQHLLAAPELLKLHATNAACMIARAKPRRRCMSRKGESIVMIGLLYKASLMVASIDFQVLLRLRPYPMRGHRLL
jgi:hypothetical protein